MGKSRFLKSVSRDSPQSSFHGNKLVNLYKTVAEIVRKALNYEGTLKTLVYENAKALVKVHLRLSIEVIRHRKLLVRLVEETDLVEKEQLTPELAQVLVYELLLSESRKPPKGNELLDKVSAHREQLEDALQQLRDSGEFDKLVLSRPEVNIPRYGRVNTLLTTLGAVVTNLRESGFRLVDTEGKTYEEYLECVRSLQNKEFVLDFHFPNDLLVFNPRQYLAKLFIYSAGHLVLHDKTSYFPVACLGPPRGSTVLDACAAPGLKTIHIAAKMENKGKLIALDINARRMEKLVSNLNAFGVQCCQNSLDNFLSVDPSSEPFSDVEYILLDMPCSHSTNLSQLLHNVDGDDANSPNRLRSLCALQFRFLCHALRFPRVKRIVYTTTSIENQENEKLIQDVLSKNPDHFKLARAFPEWHTRGDPDFKFGEYCVRARPEVDLTDACFVAVLERIKDGPLPVKSFSARSTDVVDKLPIAPFVDRVGTKKGSSPKHVQVHTEVKTQDNSNSETAMEVHDEVKMSKKKQKRLQTGTSALLDSKNKTGAKICNSLTEDEEMKHEIARNKEACTELLGEVDSEEDSLLLASGKQDEEITDDDTINSSDLLRKAKSTEFRKRKHGRKDKSVLELSKDKMPSTNISPSKEDDYSGSTLHKVNTKKLSVQVRGGIKMFEGTRCLNVLRESRSLTETSLLGKFKSAKNTEHRMNEEVHKFHAEDEPRLSKTAECKFELAEFKMGKRNVKPKKVKRLGVELENTNNLGKTSAVGKQKGVKEIKGEPVDTEYTFGGINIFSVPRKKKLKSGC